MELNTLLGFFRPPALRLLIEDSDGSDVMIHQKGMVFIDRGGSIMDSGIVADRMSVRGGLTALARDSHKDFSQAQPILDARLPNGSRLAGLLHQNGEVTATIRRFVGWFTADELVANGTIRVQERDLLAQAINPSSGKAANILTSGATGSGKTVLTKAIIGFIPLHKRLIVIENPPELAIEHPNCERWEADPPAMDGSTIRTEARLLAHALRHRPDHIILGECRSEAEAFMTLRAMNTGHDGSLTTIHANSAVDALDRFINLALGFRGNLTHENIQRQVLRAIDLVAHMDRDRNGKRRLTELLRVRDDGQHEVLYQYAG